MKKIIVGMACILLCSIGLGACMKKDPQSESAAAAAKALDKKPSCDLDGCPEGKVCRADGRCSSPVFEVVFDIPPELFAKVNYDTYSDAIVNIERVRVDLPILDLPDTIRILWGDEPAGADWNIISSKENETISHEYTNPGKYHVKLLDSDVTWGYNMGYDVDLGEVDPCGYSMSKRDGRKYLTEVVSFGNIRLNENAFIGTGLKKLPKKDIPDATKLRTLRYAFACTEFNQPVSFDTSNVTDMSWMFYQAKSFNQPVNFNTSNVMFMNTMFASAASFNQPVNFDTSNVIDMWGMFSGAASFNQPVNFNTSKVTNMSGMFSDTDAFNQPVNFNTSKVTTMEGMFYKAAAFNQPVNFNTSNVTNMRQMFYKAKAFNQPVNFNTSNVNNMCDMFEGATSFNQPLNFDTSNVMESQKMSDACRRPK